MYKVYLAVCFLTTLVFLDFQSILYHYSQLKSNVPCSIWISNQVATTEGHVTRSVFVYMMGWLYRTLVSLFLDVCLLHTCQTGNNLRFKKTKSLVFHFPLFSSTKIKLWSV